MMREAIATGETVEIAFRRALDELGVETAEFEILETPTKKTFGLFGGSLAKVRAYIEEEVEEIFTKSSVTAGGQLPVEKASEYLLSVLSAMGLEEVTVDYKEVPEGAEIVLSGEDVGFIIGHRGETLDSLQYLSSLVANQADGDYYRITLDVGNYREKRKDTLDSLGKKMANKALKTGRNQSLEPMNPYERRLIHTAVQTVEGAKSWSEGEDINRHVVIGPVDGERYQRKNRYQGRNNRSSQGGDRRRPPQGGRNNYQKPYEKRQDNRQAAPSAQTAAKRQDDSSAPIYGKIEKK